MTRNPRGGRSRKASASSPARHRRTIGRGPHLRVHHRRRRLLRRRRGGIAVALAVVGPGLLAGLSDDDPAGITTYSILGAEHGYRLLWVLALSTAMLIVFHELAARLGVVTGKGMILLVRERFGRRAATVAVGALVVANLGTLCAEFAGIAVGARLLTGVERGIAVPVAAVAVVTLVLGASFHRVEHVLLALSAVFAAYLVAGVLADPDWSAAARGLAVPSLPGTRDALLVIVATVGTTLAPWGLAFMQSYAVDKRLTPDELPWERVDVATGAILTGVIGAFIVIACAATLHPAGVSIDDGADAARALEPLAGSAAATLFGLGFVGAALLAAAVVPLSTAYSLCEAVGHPAGLHERPRRAPLFYGTFVAAVGLAAGVVLIPSLPLVPVLFLTQALNAVLLLAILPFLRALGRDPSVLGDHRLGPAGSIATAVAMLLVAVACVALLVLTVG